MQKISTMRTTGGRILQGDKLTIGLDLGDRFSSYCVLDETGKILLEQKLQEAPRMKRNLDGELRSGHD